MRISSLIQSFLNAIEIDIRRTCLYSRYNFVRNVHTSSQISCTIYACASSWALVIGEVCLLLELFFWSFQNSYCDRFLSSDPQKIDRFETKILSLCVSQIEHPHPRALNGTFVRKVASVILNPIDNETPCAPINIKQERLWTFFSVVFRLPKLLQGKSLTTITHNWPRALRYVYEEMRGSCTK